MGKTLASLALTASLLGFPGLSSANHPVVEQKPVLEEDYVVEFEGAKIRMGIFKLYNIGEVEPNPGENYGWDYAEYIPYCNGKIGHPFYTFDKRIEKEKKGVITFYDISGKEFKKINGDSSELLPPLWLYQREYKCGDTQPEKLKSEV